MTKAQQFFYDNAGYSHDPATKTPEQGRIESAERLAAAEAWARDTDMSFAWELDNDGDSSDFNDDPDPWLLWQCVARRGSEVVASLCAIDFGRDGQPWGDPYRRVVEAELALEAMPD